MATDAKRRKELPSPAAAQAMGEADGEKLAQAVAAVLLAAHIPALYGALTLAEGGLSKIPGSADFVAGIAEDALGSSWPWRGQNAYAGGTRESRHAYRDGFAAKFASALRSETTLGGAVRELAREPSGPTRTTRSDDLFPWVAAMTRLGTRAKADEDDLNRKRAAEQATGRLCRWIVPAPRKMGWLERGSVSREFPATVEPLPGQFVAVVTSRDVGKPFFRAAFSSRIDAAEVAAAVASVRWQIAHLPHLSELDRTLDMGMFWREPFGIDVFDEIIRIADRSDRMARGMGVAAFGDSIAWPQIERGEVGALLRRFDPPPFGLGNVHAA